MAEGNHVRLAIAGIFAATLLAGPAIARDSGFSVEFSAQSAPQGDKKAKPGPARPGVARPAPVQRAAPRPMVRTAPVQRSVPRTVQAPPRIQRNVVAPRVVTPRAVTPRVATPRPGVVAPRPSVSAAPRIITAPRQTNRAFTPRGPRSNVVNAARIRNAPVRGIGRTTIQGRNYSVWRSNYRVRRGNGWRTFVALGALGTIAIGAAEFYPYAYIQAPENYCDGRTEDGCQLVWEDVETVEGDVIPQCVAYCPWQ